MCSNLVRCFCRGLPKQQVNNGSRQLRETQVGCRHHCALDSSEHRPLAHTLSANHHAVGTYLTYYIQYYTVRSYFLSSLRVRFMSRELCTHGLVCLPDLCTSSTRCPLVMADDVTYTFAKVMTKRNDDTPHLSLGSPG